MGGHQSIKITERLTHGIEQNSLSNVRLVFSSRDSSGIGVYTGKYMITDADGNVPHGNGIFKNRDQNWYEGEWERGMLKNGTIYQFTLENVKSLMNSNMKRKIKTPIWKVVNFEYIKIKRTTGQFVDLEIETVKGPDVIIEQPDPYLEYTDNLHYNNNKDQHDDQQESSSSSQDHDVGN